MALMPWFAALAVLLLVAWALAGFSRARLRLGRLFDLHADERGSAQSLSFVLTLPVFIMVMMMIVQVSQLMIGVIVVNYAAFTSARAAAVWIPAAMPGDEGPNCISSYQLDPSATDQVSPEMNPQAADFGPNGRSGGETFLINPGSPKYQKISMAAVLACMAVSPSRDVGLQTGTSQASSILKQAYASLAPSSQSNSQIGPRLDNKLAYALSATNVEVRFYHANSEPPLTTYYLPDDPGEFYSNEIGWQDMITVKVQYQFPLLPGPGRLLARYVVGPSGAPDKVAKTIQKQGNVYVYPLEAQAVIGNEGEKSVVTYAYQN
jgi:hypothetical protein